jgi:hypothetical protein
VPSILVAQQLADALGTSLSALLKRAEKEPV